MTARVGDRLRFEPAGVVTVLTGKVELGQGVETALAQIAAHELGVAPARVTVVAGDTARCPDEWFTAGSLSVETAGLALRRAAATARELALAAAARLLQADPSRLALRDGAVLLDGAPSSLGYWSPEVSPDPAAPVDDDAPFAGPGGPLGASPPATHLRARATGPAFIHDMAPDGLLHGRVVRPPRAGARLLGVDRAAVAATPGFAGLVVDGDLIGVLATGERALERLATRAARAARWSEASPAPVWSGFDVPAPEAPPDGWAGSVSRPFLAHAAIGPSCALARRDGGPLTVWTHSQGVFALRDALARAFGLDPADVRAIHAPGAGCYGHNGADDAAFEAAWLAGVAGGAPVRVLWTRADELAVSPAGPPMRTDVTARLGADGRVTSMRLTIVSGPHGCRPGAQGGVNLLGATLRAEPLPFPEFEDFPTELGGGADRNATPLYAIPNVAVAKHIVNELPARTSSMRTLGAQVNVVAIEAAMDELAARADADPVAFRLAHLEDPRARLVVARAAAMAGWPGPEPGAGAALGFGFARYKNRAGYCAVVADVLCEEEVRVTRVWSAVDGGLIVNASGAAAQVEGGIVQAISWTLKEALPVGVARDGPLGWADYRILTFAEAPRIDVDFVGPPDAPSLGLGEVSTGPASAAVANAIARALGVRSAALPITRDRLATLLA